MRWLLLVVASFVAGAAGCSKSADTTASSPPPDSRFVLQEEPSGAQGVQQLKEVAADGADVVVEGRIGGDTKPFVSGQAAFLIVDSSLKACNEKDDDGCATPWDFCCDVDLLPGAKAMVKIVDQQGKLVPTDARQLLGVKELQTVVVRGQAQRDASGNLVVLATGVFVKK